MSSLPKIIVLIFNFFILLWLFFVIQRFAKIGVDIPFLNVSISAIISAVLTYLVWKQHLNFGAVFKYSIIFWAIGLILGLVYIFIFAFKDAQAIFIIFFTAPIGWLIGITYSVFKQKNNQTINDENDSTKNKIH